MPFTEFHLLEIDRQTERRVKQFQEVFFICIASRID